MFQSIETREGVEGCPAPSERRKILRVRSVFPAQLQIGETSYRGSVTDIGVDGIRLKSLQAPLEVDQLVHVSAAQCPPGLTLAPIRCQILWVKQVGRDLTAGCRYADSRENMMGSWVRYVLQELGFDETVTFQKRRMESQRAIPARLLGQTVSCDARVINLGVNGALVESRHEIPQGTALELEMSLWRILPKLSMPATVMEVREDQATRQYHYSLQFGALYAPQIKLLGNYVINQLNQTST